MLKYIYKSEFIVYCENSINPYKNMSQLKPGSIFVIFERDLEMFKDKLESLGLSLLSYENLTFLKIPET